MKLYVIPKGTKVVLANLDGSLDGSMEEVISKSEVSFSDMVEDVVYNYNRAHDTIGYKPQAPAHIRKMFNQNYIMFNIGSEHTNKPYKYVILSYDDVKVLC